MGKLEKTKIELDETDTKLFPKPKKAKGNFNKTIATSVGHGYNVKGKWDIKQQKDLTSKVKRDKIPVGRKKINKEKEMQKTIKAQKYAALAALAAGAIYGITRYTTDTVVIVLGTLLVALLVEKSIK